MRTAHVECVVRMREPQGALRSSRISEPRACKQRKFRAGRSIAGSPWEASLRPDFHLSRTDRIGVSGFMDAGQIAAMQGDWGNRDHGAGAIFGKAVVAHTSIGVSPQGHAADADSV